MSSFPVVCARQFLPRFMFQPFHLIWWHFSYIDLTHSVLSHNFIIICGIIGGSGHQARDNTWRGINLIFCLVFWSLSSLQSPLLPAVRIIVYDGIASIVSYAYGAGGVSLSNRISLKFIICTAHNTQCTHIWLVGSITDTCLIYDEIYTDAPFSIWITSKCLDEYKLMNEWKSYK